MAIEEINVADLHALGPAVVLIDVREDTEWASGHVEHARHVALATVPARLGEFDGSPTYVICKVGGRSYRACEYAASNGRHVVNVAGGMLAWADAGFDVVTTSDGRDA